ncbi:MAG: hypothetical protein M3065_20415 [Actinomycetota bacterium]|nr:hypothetical protein [Actinomycetota bacterium]
MSSKDAIPRWQWKSEEEHVSDFQAQVGALRAIGALSAGEVSAWVTRLKSELARAGDPNPPGPPDRESAERARVLLVELLEPSARQRGTGTNLRSMSPFERALSALEYCGLVSRDEAAGWQDWFLARVDLPEDEKRTMRGRWRPSKSFEGIELLNVIPGPPTLLGDVRITCLELYSDGAILRWRRVLELSSEQRRRREQSVVLLGDREEPGPVPPQLELRDDLGTVYGGGEASTTESVRDGLLIHCQSRTFSPIRPDANVVEVSCDAEVLALRTGR